MPFKIKIIKISLKGCSLIVTCLDWVGDAHTGRITCVMDSPNQMMESIKMAWVGLQPNKQTICHGVASTTDMFSQHDIVRE